MRYRGTVGIAALAVAALVGCGGSSGADGASATTTSGTDAAAPDSCSASTLHGHFIYEVHGAATTADGTAPYLEIGELEFGRDGTGTRRQTNSATLAEGDSSFEYTVGDDCIGEIEAEDGTYRTFVDPSGAEVTFFPAGSGDVQTDLDGLARAAVTSGPDCSTATLRGTYQYRSRGTLGGEGHIEHGFEVYDGDGKVTNVYRVSGEDEPTHLEGTYTVDADCRAVVTYTDGPTLEQYLSADGDEFYWLQTDGFDEPGVFGGHEHRVSAAVDTAILGGAG